MFSGLTNQVSSWMGAAKGEPQDEEVPSPPHDATAASASLDPSQAADNPTQSPTKPSSKLEMLSNVKSQVTGWLPTNISMPTMPTIPGLRKNTDATAEPSEIPPAEASEEPAKEPKDDDDNSRYISATGGADSRPGSGPPSPTDENAQPVGNENRKIYNIEAIEVPDMKELTTKAVAGAKYLGSFLSSAVNKAGAKVSEASAKIKKTVEENSLLGELNKEQDAFIKSQDARGGAAALPPWSGAANEAALKEECLSLSTERRNFVRAPPAGVEFSFDYDAMYPVAQAVMAEDPNLEKMRFDLVPKVITEENFWRNYFYRVSLICQAHEAERTGAQDSDLESEEPSETKAKSDNADPVADAKRRIEKLRVDRGEHNDQWEKELEAELRDYEVVAGRGGEKTAGDRWEAECDELLADEPDLK